MSDKTGIVAQMSTYPMDVRHVEFLLPHQIRALSKMVDRFVVTIDTHQSRSGRYRGTNFEHNLAKLREIVAAARKTYPQLEVHDVDYSARAARDVAQYFFGRDAMPIKAWDGGPFYAYFYGMYVANAQYVIHFDGDILFGGGSTTWAKEAIAQIEEHPDVLVIAPFPGPPREDRRIFGHEESGPYRVTAADAPYPAYRHSSVSTRIFMMDLNKFKRRLGVLPWWEPSRGQRLKARLLGNPPDAREAEVLFTHALRTHDMHRVDMLGSAPGFWSLHPPYRSDEFYRRLPELVAAVESGAVPEAQRGHYDVNDSMVDWNSARAANSWYLRYWRMARHRLAGLG